MNDTSAPTSTSTTTPSTGQVKFGSLEQLWSQNKFEFWSVIAFFVFSFIATLIRVWKRRQQNVFDGRNIVYEDDRAVGAGPEIVAPADVESPNETIHGVKEERSNAPCPLCGGSRKSGEGVGGPTAYFRPTAGRVSWRW